MTRSNFLTVLDAITDGRRIPLTLSQIWDLLLEAGHRIDTVALPNLLWAMPIRYQITGSDPSTMTVTRIG